MSLYRDEVARISLPQLRAQYPPRIFKMLRRVTLYHGTQSCEVVLDSAVTRGCIDSPRRWFLCPRCSARTTVIGFAHDGPGCRACVRWRARNRVLIARASVWHDDSTAPHLRNVQSRAAEVNNVNEASSSEVIKHG
jgi:hypothetical protein